MWCHLHGSRVRCLLGCCLCATLLYLLCFNYLLNKTASFVQRSAAVPQHLPRATKLGQLPKQLAETMHRRKATSPSQSNATSPASDAERKSRQPRCSWTTPDKQVVRSLNNHRLLQQLQTQPIKPGRQFWPLGHELYIYSAYFDNRTLPLSGTVRLIALATKPTAVQCVFQPGLVAMEKEGNGSSRAFYVTQAQWDALPERHFATYGVYLLSCATPLSTAPSDSERDGCYSQLDSLLLSRKHKSQTLKLALWHPQHNNHNTRRYAICTPPLYGHRYSLSNLAEFVELNQLLGAQHFQIYMLRGAQQAPDNASCLLRFYQGSGRLSVAEWKLPVSPLQVWYYGQLAAMHDCLYAQLWATQLLAFFDFDELAVPLPPGSSVPEAAGRLLAEHSNSTHRLAALRLPSLQLRRQSYSAGGGGSERLQPLYSQRHQWQRGAANYLRSKSVVLPSRVHSLGVHHVHRVWDPRLRASQANLWTELSQQVLNVSHSRLAIFHYSPRSSCPGGMGCGDEGARRNARLQPYKTQLRAAVRRSLKGFRVYAIQHCPHEPPLHT